MDLTRSLRTSLENIKYLKTNVFFLYFMSMYPIPKNAHWISIILFYFWRFVCPFGLGSLAVLCLLDVYLKEDYVFIDISSNILNSGIFTAGFIRVIYFYVYEDSVKKIVDDMNALFRDESNTRMKTERKMSKHKLVTVIFTIYWAIVVFFTGEFTALLPLAFAQENEKPLSIQAHYPYDWKSKGFYEFTFFSQALTQSFMGFSYGNADMFYACTLILTAGQFKVLAWEFENVIFSALIDYGFDVERIDAFASTFNSNLNSAERMKDGSNGDYSNTSDEYLEIVAAIKAKEFAPFLKNRTVNCIKRHQMLLEYSRMLNEFLAPLLLPCLSFGLFYIIFIAFTLLVSTDKSSFLGLTEYLITALVEVFFFAYFGQMLTNESDNVREAMYKSPWYLCTHNYLSIFKFSQLKASDSVVITGGPFFIMKLEFFITICKTAGSYFAVLRQVTE